MATFLSSLETQARRHLIEQAASFWSSPEMIDLANIGIKDLWRDTVDLKAEHYMRVNNTDVTFPANATTLLGLPADVHKVIIIEPRDLSTSSANVGLMFRPKDYNHKDTIGARSMAAIDPASSTIYYSITGQGGPVNAPVIYCAPKVNSSVNISFAYVPTLSPLTAGDANPIPGESDNAVIAWMVAFARAKEREDRSPDPNWLAVYATEKAHLLQSLGLREYQEPQFVDALFEQYWG
jgi:hypothetical protein